MPYKPFFRFGVSTVLAATTVQALVLNLPVQNNGSNFSQDLMPKDYTLIEYEASTLMAAREASDMHPPE
ncbi:MAG: hypothetical protein SWJ54_17510 [Cyanobacteriota bacterium]|nr:hypothetical protein [Cyanobacteriota bacterium]